METLKWFIKVGSLIQLYEQEFLCIFQSLIKMARGLKQQRYGDLSFLLFEIRCYENAYASLKMRYSPYVNKGFVYMSVSKILNFIRQLFIFS